MQPNLTLLVKHQYDALNRLVASTLSAQATSQCFYLKDRLVTEIQGTEQRSIMQHDDQLLAQQQRQSGNVETRLLATDPQRSVLNVLDATRPHPLAYTPYGHRPLGNGLLSLLGFNGERQDPVTGWYLLGNGYRAFNPVLMRFNGPDNLSPFGKGGLNAYGYCVGDPVNRSDPNGHWSIGGMLNGLSNFRNRVARRFTANASEAATGTAGGASQRVSSTPFDNVAPPISRPGTSSTSAPINIPQPSHQRDTAHLADSFEFKGMEIIGPEKPPAPTPPNLGPEEWADIELVFQHAPHDATTNDLMRTIYEMRNIRTGRTSFQHSTAFLEQFIGD
ncbi:RHS repeat-associated core domain-containing protein [Pseudomonas putida]|uniref:RHS repeat-associated core domain-containing protein n=1 Tax=Pseudomonas putida TaxID=303 RepID=UPI001EF8AA35|nr:RHS repeat-associated core domain-containing protein [Pseudomonas putida]